MRWAAGLLVALLCGCTPTSVPEAGSPSAPSPASPVSPSVPSAAPALAGVTVFLDPGHQLGNARHPAQVNAPVPDGAGGTKACNTVGASTDSGLAETTFNFSVATLAAARLRELGARVVLSRSSDSASLWGPCVDVRGRLGNSFAGSSSAVKVSIHADGGPASAAGFHVITSPSSPASGPLARAMKAALAASFPIATYVAGGTGLDSRTDLATLNHSRIPTVLVELGNMRNASDAERMTSPSGRTAYAEALVDGILAWAE